MTCPGSPSGISSWSRRFVQHSFHTFCQWGGSGFWPNQDSGLSTSNEGRQLIADEFELICHSHSLSQKNRFCTQKDRNILGVSSNFCLIFSRSPLFLIFSPRPIYFPVGHSPPPIPSPSLAFCKIYTSIILNEYFRSF